MRENSKARSGCVNYQCKTSYNMKKYWKRNNMRCSLTRELFGLGVCGLRFLSSKRCLRVKYSKGPSKTLQSAKYLDFTVLKIFSENFWVQVQPNIIEAKPMRPHDQHAPTLALGPKSEEEEEEENVKKRA